MPQRKISFPYTPFPIEDPVSGRVVKTIYRPLLPLQIRFGRSQTRPFKALLDSGSDRNLFPAALGVLAGINIKKGRQSKVHGIGDSKLVIYTHKVEFILLAPNPQIFTAYVDFSYEQDTPLLGRTGFFEFFNGVEFKEKERLIELTL